MNLPDLYGVLVLAMLVLAPVVFVVLFYISAPYGRFTRAGWGPTLNNRVGWFVMEAPVSLVVAFIMLFLVELNTVTWVFFSCGNCIIFIAPSYILFRCEQVDPCLLSLR